MELNADLCVGVLLAVIAVAMAVVVFAKIGKQLSRFQIVAATIAAALAVAMLMKLKSVDIDVDTLQVAGVAFFAAIVGGWILPSLLHGEKA